MADTGSRQTLASIAAGMMAKAAEQNRPMPTGVVGKILKGVTNQIRDYNAEFKEQTKAQVKRKQLQLQLNTIDKEQLKIRKRFREGLVKDQDEVNRYTKRLKHLNDAKKTLTDQYRKANEAYVTSTDKLTSLGKRQGIVSNGLAVLGAKVAGAATAFITFNEVLNQFDKRMSLGVKHMALAGDTTGGYWGTLSRAHEAQKQWSGVVTESTTELAKMGVHADQTFGMIETLSDGLRLATNEQHKLAEFTQQATMDIGHMSKLLRVSTEELATSTVDASKRFGKSTGAMADDLAGLFHNIKDLKEGSKDVVVDFRDLTKATLEAQGSFQGHNFSLRQTAEIMGTVATEAQKQGATYEASMKAAKGLTDIIQGGAAPDWAKFTAGDQLLTELKGLHKSAQESGADFQKVLAKNFSIDASTPAGKAQLTGLQKLAENYRKYGSLSSAYMAEELLRGTGEANAAMFELIKKQGTGSEGREMLKRVWGLDDAAATAATLALNSAESAAEFQKVIEEGKQATESRKPPSIKDLKEQTEGYVKAVGQAEAGIKGTLSALFSGLKNNPAITAIIGAIGTSSSVILQGLQLGLGSSIAGGLARRVAGRGIVGSIADVGRGVARAPGAAVTAARGLPSALAATGPKLLKFAGSLGLVAAGSLAVGTGLRKLFPQIDTLTQNIIDHSAKVLNFTGILDEEQAARKGITDLLKSETNENKRVRRVMQAVQDSILGDAKKGSEEFDKSIRFLKGFKEGDLKAIASQISKESQGKIGEVEAIARMKKIQAMDMPGLKPVAPRPTQEKRARMMTRAPAQVQPVDPGRAVALQRSRRTSSPARQSSEGSQSSRVGPDGTISINVNIPRDALDKSNLLTSQQSG